MDGKKSLIATCLIQSFKLALRQKNWHCFDGYALFFVPYGENELINFHHGR